MDFLRLKRFVDGLLAHDDLAAQCSYRLRDGNN